mgnify:CR=1 FL=1
MSRRWSVLALALALAAGCASSPDEAPERIEVASLDEASYRALVHPVIERACGSSDCHGNEPRGLRVYGATALRLPGAAGPTSPDEVRATYVSIVGLEPEKLDAFVARSPRSADEAYRLLVLAKPLAIERHRGGISLRKGEPAEQCILSWLLGRADAAQCTR